MPHNVYRRSGSRNWYLRIHVPTELQSLVNNGEPFIRKSLFTSVKRLAEARAAQMAADYRAEWLPLLESSKRAASDPAQTVLSQRVMDQICGHRMRSWEGTNRLEVVIFGRSDDEREEVEGFSAHSIETLESVLSQGTGSRHFKDVAKTVIEYAADMGYAIDAVDARFNDLVMQFAETEQIAQEVIAAKSGGKRAKFPEIEITSERLSAMADVFREHRKGRVDAKSISKNISIWRRFVDFVGDVALDSVKSGDIYDFFEARLHDAKDGWSQSYVDGHAKRALRDMFALARTKGLMTAANPVLGLEVTPELSEEEQEARKRPRYPLTEPQLNLLFASDWYDPSATHWTGKMKADLAARYWCPLISMCHGYRVREVVQLMRDDFEVVDGILYMTLQTEISEGASDKKEKKGKIDGKLPARRLKNKATRRTVPAHPILLQLGFLEFIDLVKATQQPGTPVFPSSIPNPESKTPIWGRSYEQAFLRHVRDRLKFGKGFGNHSFRHLLEDRIRDVQVYDGVWPAGLGEFYSGRKLPRDADRKLFREHSSAILYGNGFTPQHLLQVIGKVRFDKLKLPVRYQEWLKQAG
ncbi:DUF6538 domain-containing protein [Burkholderia sp. 8Y]|uniref:DUF6538 domain-containing protein n=1 Tax=Burkholderia sp. 8Y TaxID=2653133 RepID=UPI001359245B|nr:DUF6538 domain-containing protein [Burkholderia sp. 8Y]